ncbi:MAG TPA: formyltransferase family protein [Gemmatimonadales bacterium]
MATPAVTSGVAPRADTNTDTGTTRRLRTLLICHHDAPLHREGIARWLASFSDLAGILVIEEDSGVVRRRVKRELRRVGPLRFLDVLAMRAWHRARLASGDREWEAATLRRLRERLPDLPGDLPVAVERTPNTKGAERFVRDLAPDMIVAFCKHIIAERVFTVPPVGTFVMHPGICPEYRNAHGCFWALANGDVDNVGMTLLRIDRGVDTGPVFGYFHYDGDERLDSHIVVQHRTVFDNLDAVRDTLLAIASGTASTVDTNGRPSAAWGQPWLSAYLRWKRQARRRAPDRRPA